MIALQHLEGFGFPLRIKPYIRNLVSRQEVPHLVVRRGPPRTDNPQPLEWSFVGVVPVVEQIVEYGIKLLLGRVPGLRQIIVNARRIDGPDCGLGIGVGGKHDPLCGGIELLRFFEEINTGKARHALIGQKKRDLIAPLFELITGIESRLAGSRPQNSVIGPVFATQILNDGLKHAGVVIYG